MLPLLNRSLFDVPNIRRKALDEVAVMYHGQDGAFEIGERLFEAGAGRDVQVVDRLVEKQESAALGNEQSQLEAGAFPVR